MDPVTPFDWHRMFLGEQPPLFFLEIAFRVVVIYLFAVLLLRFMGKRGNRNLSPFEYLVIIALGSATGDAMFYPQVPILYAWLVIALIVLLSRLTAVAQLRFEHVNAYMEGYPLVLVREGRVVEDALKKARLRTDEFMAMLRVEGVEDTGEVRLAFLERTGELGLYCYDEGEGQEGESTLPEKTADV